MHNKTIDINNKNIDKNHMNNGFFQRDSLQRAREILRNNPESAQRLVSNMILNNPERLQQIVERIAREFPQQLARVMVNLLRENMELRQNQDVDWEFVQLPDYQPEPDDTFTQLPDYKI